MSRQTAVRFDSVDRLRGLIMILMAIDHASFFIARVHPAETWAYPPPYYATPVAFFTRWITHLCAPGFFLLMGAGMGWFAASRAAAGWNQWQITRYFLTRGGLLLLLQHFLENPAWALGMMSGPVPDAKLPGGDGDVYLSFAVITALGAAMIFWSWLTRAPAIIIGLLSVGALAASWWMTPSPEQASSVVSVPMRLLFVPGKAGVVQVHYSIAPWLAPAGAGLLLARAIAIRPSRLGTPIVMTGLTLLAMFVVLRSLSLGEYHAAEPGLIGFLTVTKYPPSPDFFAVTLGLDLLVLAGLSRATGAWATPLAVFGRVPLFFYLLHLYVFAALSWLFRQTMPFSVMYAVWAGAILAMYPFCRRFAAFKASQPVTSWWRMW